jgi:hypothetical protein
LLISFRSLGALRITLHSSVLGNYQIFFMNSSVHFWDQII